MTAPVFGEKPKEIIANDGDKVEIQCKVSGAPRPEITWLLNKKEVKPSAVSFDLLDNFLSSFFQLKEFVQSYDGTTAKLTLPDAYVDDSGDWSCEAWNEVGQASQNVRVTIKGKRDDRFFFLEYIEIERGV